MAMIVRSNHLVHRRFLRLTGAAVAVVIRYSLSVLIGFGAALLFLRRDDGPVSASYVDVWCPSAGFESNSALWLTRPGSRIR
jgi:hypothetical protein